MLYRLFYILFQSLCVFGKLVDAITGKNQSRLRAKDANPIFSAVTPQHNNQQHTQLLLIANITMKTHLTLLLLFAHTANAFIPVGVNRGTQLLLSTRRDEIAREIEEEVGPVHVTTHDENPWKEVLAGDHRNRKQVLKQKLGAIKMENKELDKHVHALEHKLETLFAVTEVLYVNEEELQREVKELKAERNSLRKMAGRTIVLFGKRLLWPVNATLRLVGLKKSDTSTDDE